tara:strand:+ start:338 stop:784 length:447 start_codon:yes stop_codon:yes gene_type:complete
VVEDLVDLLIHPKEPQVETIQFFQQLHLQLVVMEPQAKKQEVMVDLVEEVEIQVHHLVEQETHHLLAPLKDQMVVVDLLDVQVQDLLEVVVVLLQWERMDLLMVLHQILVDQEEQDHQLQIYLELLHNLFILFQDLVKEVFLAEVEVE